MTSPTSKAALAALRRKAKKTAHARKQTASPVTPAEFAYALEELRIYGAELEIQNEELEESRMLTEELQTRYFRHFDLAPIGMIRLNDKEMILEANFLGARMLGIDRARLRSGKVSFASRLSTNSRAAFWKHAQKARASSEMESCDLSLENRNGEQTFIKMQSISSAGGEGATDLFATLTDLTEHRRAEVYRLELERKLLGRQKLENIGTLAGGIAHDLNNILQIINCSLDLAAKNKRAGSTLLKQIANAKEASDRATNLSKRLLTFSKGGSPVKQILCLREILGPSITFWLSGSKLHLDLFIAPDLLPVLVDPVQFAQVIENVVINARESRRNNGKLFVRAENIFSGEGDERSPFVQIEIEDQGGGIPRYVRDKIFDICFTTKAGGSGIGLATARSIMDQHGGRIEVESIAGQGTTVRLLLPAADQVTLPPVAPCADAVVTQGSGRILLIDDEKAILEVVSLTIEELGYACATAKDGKEGCEVYRLAMAEGKPFAAVLLDATIPGGLGGEAALRRLIRVDPRARVILFSGYSDSDLMMRAEEIGFKGQLTKPFTTPQLATLLHAVVA